MKGKNDNHREWTQMNANSTVTEEPDDTRGEEDRNVHMTFGGRVWSSDSEIRIETTYK